MRGWGWGECVAPPLQSLVSLGLTRAEHGPSIQTFRDADPLTLGKSQPQLLPPLGKKGKDITVCAQCSARLCFKVLAHLEHRVFP